MSYCSGIFCGNPSSIAPVGKRKYLDLTIYVICIPLLLTILCLSRCRRSLNCDLAHRRNSGSASTEIKLTAQSSEPFSTLFFRVFYCCFFREKEGMTAPTQIVAPCPQKWSSAAAASLGLKKDHSDQAVQEAYQELRQILAAQSSSSSVVKQDDEEQPFLIARTDNPLPQDSTFLTPLQDNTKRPRSFSVGDPRLRWVHWS